MPQVGREDGRSAREKLHPTGISPKQDDVAFLAETFFEKRAHLLGDVIEFVERAVLRRREQTDRVIKRACAELRLSRDQRALRTAHGSGCQHGGALEEGSSSSEAATRLRPRR